VRPPSGSPPAGRSRTDGPRRIGEVLDTTLGRLGAPGPDVLGTVFCRWEEIVGAALSAHVRPVGFRGETLVLAVDRPAWATEVRSIAPALLERIGDVAGASPPRIDVVVRPAANHR
jgi:predicted nucleic acid-binding Zn ribbon protein